jgi:LPXTG-motif cell wall-anchored protein
MAAALTALGTGSAIAAQSHSECGRVSIEHSVDNGASWTTNGRMDGAHVPATVQVRLTGDVQEGCSFSVSLASYSAQGPTWQTSGTQAFLGWATATLTKSQPTATLDVSQHAPTCYGQIDLYGNGTKYDGVTGALPHYPDSATPTDLISAWNGGTACSSTPTPPSTPTPAPSTPAPTQSAPAVAPTASTAPSTAPVSTKPPVGTPQVPPTSTKPTGNLAETGSNSSETTIVAGSAAALVVIGAGAVVATRRRRAGSH